MRRSAVLVASLTLLAPMVRSQLTLADLMARMESAIGPAAGASGGDWVLSGTLTAQGQSFLQTISIRREPFAYREELRWVSPAPDVAPPPGVARRLVFLSDGARSWNLADDLEPAGPLAGWAAEGVLDNALLFRALLDPRAALAEGAGGRARVATEEAKPHDTGDEAIFVS